MLGAIAGDIIGSVYEASPIKSKEFVLLSPANRFTDDTVLTIAVAEVLLDGGEYAAAYRDYYRKFPHQGYGYGFSRWARMPEATAWHSYGNGSAMRVSPVGWALDSLADVLQEAQRSAIVSHNHEEGIKGAQAVATAVYLARQGCSKQHIRNTLGKMFNYDLETPLDEIRPGYSFDVSCQGSVPEAIIAFLESGDYEDAVRNAVSFGGDSDTMACIAGAIAEAYYRDINAIIINNVYSRLPATLSNIVSRFTAKYCRYQHMG